MKTSGQPWPSRLKVERSGFALILIFFSVGGFCLVDCFFVFAIIVYGRTAVVAKKRKPQACGGIFASSEEGVCGGRNGIPITLVCVSLLFYWRIREEGSSSILLLFPFFLKRAPTHFPNVSRFCSTGFERDEALM